MEKRCSMSYWKMSRSRCRSRYTMICVFPPVAMRASCGIVTARYRLIMLCSERISILGRVRSSTAASSGSAHCLRDSIVCASPPSFQFTVVTERLAYYEAYTTVAYTTFGVSPSTPQHPSACRRPAPVDSRFRPLGKVVNPNRTIHNIRGTTEYRYSADVALESITRPIHGFAKTKTVNRLTLFSTGHS